MWVPPSKCPRSGGPGELPLVVNVTGQRECSYKVQIFTSGYRAEWGFVIGR
jgi:hypothetical protein